MNTSNDSTLGEFDYWKPALVFVLTSELLFLFPASLFINVSLFVTLSKAKPLRKPLNSIHQSVILLNCFNIIPDIITTFIFVPPLLRSCECSQTDASVYFLIELLYVGYQPLNIACLGIFQLLIIKGKKTWVSFKSVGASILFCSGMTTLLLVEGIVLVTLSGQSYICHDVCPGHFSATFSGIGITFYTYGAIFWFPSFLVVTVCTIWSCTIFKSSYTGGNDDLNRRVISLPIVLPIALAIPSALSSSFIAAIEPVLMSSELAQPSYWIIFSRLLAFQFHELLSGIAYPCILLLLNPKISHHWKEQLLMCKKCRKSIRVMPVSGEAQTSSQD